MKYLLLIFTSLLICLNLTAQQPETAFKDGTEWWTHIGWGASDPNPAYAFWDEECEVIKLNGEIIIEGNTYLKFYKTELFNSLELEYIGGIRTSEDEQQVYFRHKADTTDFLLFDYSLEVGDTLISYSKVFEQELLITHIDFNYEGYRRLHFKPLRYMYNLEFSTNSFVDYVFHTDSEMFHLEGLGATYGLLPLFIIPQKTTNTPYSEKTLRRITTTKGIIYSNNDNENAELRCTTWVNNTELSAAENKVYPTLFNEYLFIETQNEAPQQIAVYNIKGQLIHQINQVIEQHTINTNTWQKGSYFINIGEPNNSISYKVVKW